MLATLLLAQLAVVCDPADPLRPLAGETALQEHSAVTDTWDGARAEFLVWVASADRLSDRRIVEFARAWRDRFPETAVGIITARTPEQARTLWRRGAEARPAPAASFNPFAIAATFFLGGASGALYVRAAGRPGRWIALLFATLPAWLPALLHLGFKAGTNLLVFRTHIGAPVYLHRMELLGFLAAALILGLVLCVFVPLRRLPLLSKQR